jgi:translation initiation factor 2-alpha kinase 4
MPLTCTTACDLAEQLKASLHAGMQVLAVDVPPPVFDSLVKDSAWLTDDDLWRSISNAFPVGQAGYAQQVREAAFKRRAEGHKFLVLVAVKEEKVGLLTL